jgi:hypothetical protein
MSNRTAINRRLAAASIVVTATVGLIAFSVMRSRAERQSVERFCSISHLDPMSCVNRMEANRKSWG